MRFILSQELSRHNRDKKCSPVEQQEINYKTYEISYETIEILPSYTIITPSETATTQDTNIGTHTKDSSKIFLIPPITQETEKGFRIQDSTHHENDNSEQVGTIKSWNCGRCAFR